MAAHEWRVLSELLRCRNFALAERTGLKKEHFKDIEAQQIYEFIRKHYYASETAKQMPLVETIRRRWPSFEMTALSKEDSGALATLAKELKLASLSADMKALASEFSELVEDDPEEALKVMRNTLPAITYSFESKGGFGLREIIEGVREQYEGARTGSIFGLPWPWECLQNDTRGKNKGNLIVFYGRMKSMKTWLALYNACHDYLNNKARVMIWSREMDQSDMKLRLGSLLAKVDYQCLDHGNLPRHLYKRAMETLVALDKNLSRTPEEIEQDISKPSDLIVLCGREAPKTMSGLRAAIEQYQPDIVYVDSFYHLESDRVRGNMQLWNKILLLAEDLKEMAIDCEIPVVIAGQANRDGENTVGETMTDMAGADRISAEADLVIRVVKKRGKELHEEDYEGAWELEARGLSQEKVTFRSGPVIKLPVNRIVKPGQIITPGQFIRGQPEPLIMVPAKATVQRNPRVCAEIAMMLAGNRKGTLEGFLLQVIPGYDFHVLEPNITIKRAKEWLGGTPKRMMKGGGDETPKGISPMSFRSLKTSE